MGDNPGSKDNIVIIHPDFEKLKADIEKLRTEFSMLVLERDELLYRECKNIEMVYMLSIGKLEYKAYEIECAILRLKRKAELIQAKKNRQEKVILPKIEAILDEEFSQYKEKLDEQMGKMNDALKRRKGKFLSKSESSELKRLYRSVVKVLHPDINPGLGKEKLIMFHNALEAYEKGDIDGMRIISAMISEPVLPDEKAGGTPLLMKEKKRLIKIIEKVKIIIDEIKSEYPYTMKPIVENPEKTQEKKLELEDRIKALKQTLHAYTQKIEEMLR